MREQGRRIEPSRLRLEFPGRMEDRHDEGTSQGSGRRLPLHARIELLLPVAAVQPGPPCEDQEARRTDEESCEGNGICSRSRSRVESIECWYIRRAINILKMESTPRSW